MRLRSIVILFLAAVVVAGALYHRSRAPGPEAGEHEKAIVPPPPTEAAHPRPSPLAAPALSELQPTLDRVFERGVTVDHATRTFVAGDFNGDDVTDLALAVRPRSREAVLRLNAERTRWHVQDVTAPPAVVPDPVTVAAGDALLAVIHGAAESGWRNLGAREGYLLKNAGGAGLRRRPLIDVPPAIRMRVIRTHAGDVMVANRGGRPGVIFWTGAAYVLAELEAPEQR
jgi:hypothetical protein